MKLLIQLEKKRKSKGEVQNPVVYESIGDMTRGSRPASVMLGRAKLHLHKLHEEMLKVLGKVLIHNLTPPLREGHMVYCLASLFVDA